jgi:ATP/ADP translocase
MFLAAWLVYSRWGGAAPLGTLFVTREIALTMVLMHFGTFLQDYFLRSELNRILPVIYAGGRVGGIIGGGALGWFAERIGTVNLVPGVVALLLVSWGTIIWISLAIRPRDEDAEELQPFADLSGRSMSDASTQMRLSDADGSAPQPHQPGESQPSLVTCIQRFLNRVVTCPLLGWLTVATLLFIICRWFLAYQYTAFFEGHFDDDVELARFLGRYTQIALLISLFLQLFVINRLVSWLGVSSTHLLYSVLVTGGLIGNVLASSLPVAVASRFLESELRFGLRNPVNQMMVNRFAKRIRIVVRGWSLGWLIPIGTLVASGLIAALLRLGGPLAVAVVGLPVGICFVLSAIRVGRAYDRFEQAS